MRVSKDPESRKMEILETAMELFLTNGYEHTSMLDISKKLNVSQGLCYRYFKSKVEIYEEALDYYTDCGVDEFKKVICDKDKTNKEKLLSMADVAESNNNCDVFHQFYNLPQNHVFHEQVLITLCKKLLPIITQELQEAINKGELKLVHVSAAASFCLYGQLGIWNDESISISDKKKITQELVMQVLGI